jgi:large subunit ribosomal protein L25
LHVDFLRVSMTETMTATVPLVFIGESPAIKDLGGTLVQGLDHVVVSALPGDIPQHIEVDLAQFGELEVTLHVADLPPIANVAIVTDGGQMVAKVASPRVQVEEEAAEAAAPAEAEPAGDDES